MKLGDRAKDKITGLKGILTGRASYLTGCEQWLITPEGVKENGEIKEGYWFDVMRIAVTKSGAVNIPRPREVPAAG